MPDIDIHIAPLIVKFLDGSLTDAEQEVLNEWLEQSAANRALFAELQEPATLQTMLRNYDNIDPQAAYARWQQQQKQPKRININRYRWLAAASLFLLLAAGTYWFIRHQFTKQPVVADKVNDIPPGHTGALLTLANGKVISLDSISNGVVAIQGGSTATVNNGVLSYEGSTDQLLFNTISTPKGRQFQVTLPDGTRVWLNSASSIRYPASFPDDQRQVTITGEAYFEVAKDPGKPFSVHAAGRQEVKVLGTDFNINAYNNEATINTTLLEGAVRVSPLATNEGQAAKVLRPGQQAQLGSNNGTGKDNTINIIENADLEKVMAWKNGQFNFRGESLDEVLKQLERWYNIEIIYESGIPDLQISGEMSRGVSLDVLLSALNRMGLNYRREDRKLIVLPTAR